ncbi:acyl-CoA N-acyltransferase [Aspergillus ambiguus]|uniref:GNAT family N-acetyltransferase n=1 Tax=Aspergillus ambiguus TaxID=176160 RepID=UPI003CCDDE73
MGHHYTPSDGLTILPASPEHVPIIQSMVDVAYSKYIPRMGQLPAPMVADYNEILNTLDVYVLQTADQEVVGSVVLSLNTSARSLQVQNLVVDPAAQGRGYGRILMSHAEQVARQHSFTTITLYTNVKMYENLQLYAKLGFVESDRRTEHGYDRVYFRKDLS